MGSQKSWIPALGTMVAYSKLNGNPSKRIEISQFKQKWEPPGT